MKSASWSMRTLFMVACDQTVQPAAEIEEAVWIAADAPRDLPIAPLTGGYVLPLHKQLRGRFAPSPG
jgi:hypothetical protein